MGRIIAVKLSCVVWACELVLYLHSVLFLQDDARTIARSAVFECADSIFLP